MATFIPDLEQDLIELGNSVDVQLTQVESFLNAHLELILNDDFLLRHEFISRLLYILVDYFESTLPGIIGICRSWSRFVRTHKTQDLSALAQSWPGTRLQFEAWTQATGRLYVSNTRTVKNLRDLRSEIEVCMGFYIRESKKYEKASGPAAISSALAVIGAIGFGAASGLALATPPGLACVAGVLLSGGVLVSSGALLHQRDKCDEKKHAAEELAKLFAFDKAMDDPISAINKKMCQTIVDLEDLEEGAELALALDPDNENNWAKIRAEHKLSKMRATDIEVACRSIILYGSEIRIVEERIRSSLARVEMMERQVQNMRSENQSQSSNSNAIPLQLIQSSS